MTPLINALQLPPTPEDTNNFTLTVCALLSELDCFCNDAHFNRKGGILCQVYAYYLI